MKISSRWQLLAIIVAGAGIGNTPVGSQKNTGTMTGRMPGSTCDW